jgi:hypothetical protein
MQLVTVLGISQTMDAPHITTGRQELLNTEMFLNAVFDLIRKFDATDRKKLDAIVRSRVV